MSDPFRTSIFDRPPNHQAQLDTPAPGATVGAGARDPAAAGGSARPAPAKAVDTVEAGTRRGYSTAAKVEHGAETTHVVAGGLAHLGRGALKAGLQRLSHAAQGVSVAAATWRGATESTCRTTGGRLANAVLAGGSAALAAQFRQIAPANVFLPEKLRPSTLLQGGAGATAAVGEGAVTRDTRAMEGFHAQSKAGQHGVVLQAASRAGDWWAATGVGKGLYDFSRAQRLLFNR